jgi:predicted metal-dependent HD superfamily phosphohydrolase
MVPKPPPRKPEQEQELSREWDNLLGSFGVRQAFAQPVFLALAAAYSGADRFYHTLEHIQAVLATIERLRVLATQFAALQLAAWFHDVVYDSRARDNEERSAAYAAHVLQNLGIPSETIAAVGSMILATKEHRALHADSQLLVDADLAIFGADGADYDRYARTIRQEYAWVPEATYRAGRSQVLQKFLQRPRIYVTEVLFTDLEARARANLAREIQSLA